MEDKLKSEQGFVVPSEIPFDELKGRSLEECLYWLLDAMGAKDLEWRIGGQGDGASDGGRDLEAHFCIPTPDGEILNQTWWIESKGRSNTVEASAIKEAIHNASGRSNVDVVVIATNSTFSNPTRDWVNDWNRNHSRVRVRLWDRSALERLICKHPSVVVRLFAKALNDQGRLEVLRHKFWNYSTFAASELLRHLWKQRSTLEWQSNSLFAVICSEFANIQRSSPGSAGVAVEV